MAYCGLLVYSGINDLLRRVLAFAYSWIDTSRKYINCVGYAAHNIYVQRFF
jgi:hypothetical protein